MSQMSSITKCIEKIEVGDLFIHSSDVGLMVYNQQGFSEFRMKEGYVFTVLEHIIRDGSHAKYVKVLMANTGNIHYVLERDFDAWLSRKFINKL